MGSWGQAWDNPSSVPWTEATARATLAQLPAQFSGGRVWGCPARHLAGLGHGLGPQKAGQGWLEASAVLSSVVPAWPVPLLPLLPVACEAGSCLWASLSPSKQW